MPRYRASASSRHSLCSQSLEPRLLLADTVQLVYDLDPRNHGSLTTTAHEIVTIGNVAYFNPDHTPDNGGIELWRSDGTAAGTYRVKDIYPGDHGSNARDLTVVGNTLYFIADTPAASSRLWKTDGTEAGTVMVQDHAGQTVSASHLLAAAGDRLFFRSLGALWVTDGTAAGTRQVAPAMPEAYFNGGDYAATDTHLFFINAGELWATDGTPERTFLLQDVRPGALGSNPRALTPAGNVLYFSADNGTSGYDLWRSDGTAAGTYRIKDLPNRQGFDFGPMGTTWTGSRLFFVISPASDELWISDGTEAGTTKVTNVAWGDSSTRMVAVGGNVYLPSFVLGRGYKLFTSDVTAAGTRLVDNAAGDLTVGGGGFAGAAVGGRLFFVGTTPSAGEELWVTDGTAAGTRLVEDIRPGAAGSFPSSFAAGTERLYFTPDDPLIGREPWVSDGTEAGTHLIKDVNLTPYSGNPQELRRAGETVYFFTNDTSTPGLWKTDGTAAGTSFVSDVRVAYWRDPNSRNELFADRGGTLFFAGYRVNGSPHDNGLWRTDGSAAGTVEVGAGLGFDFPERITAIGDKVFFTAETTENFQRRYHLYATDGTDAGTVRLSDVTMGARNFVGLNGIAYFSGSTPDNFSELWRSDGTVAGTYRVTDLNPGNTGAVGLVANIGDALLLAAYDGTRTNLYRSDGTAAGTTFVKTIQEGFAFFGGMPHLVAGGVLYFVGPGGIWRSDGTAAGSYLLLPGRSMGDNFRLDTYAAAGNRLFFHSYIPDGGGESELLVTDGTAVGTHSLLRFPPSLFPPLFDMTAVGERVYFTRPVPGGGALELWRSDGTTESAARVPWDTRGPSNPAHLEALGEDLLFVGTDMGSAGRELWKVAGEPVPPPPIVWGRRLFYNNSRFDGRDGAASAADDGAIATDKQALLPGGAASFQNVSGYSRGLNGIMVDLNTRVALDDVRLAFRVGNGTPAGWAAAPAPLSVTHRSGPHLPRDVDRVTVTWADNAIRNRWLEVTVEALLEGRVIATDRFYFGHLAGETSDLRVTASDYSRTRSAARGRSAPIESPFDHNRDGWVNVLDANVSRANFFASLEPPAPSAAAPAATAAPGRRAYRAGLWLERE